MFSVFLIFILSINLFNAPYKNLINNLDKQYLFWNQQENYKHTGPISYLLSEYIRSNNTDSIPNQQSVDLALQNISKSTIYKDVKNDPSQFKDKSKYEKYKNRPNIYFILVESLWDPIQLNKSKYSKDPFYKGFRELDSLQSNNLISPTFEGKTADPELELLCGVPILKNNIPFQTEIKNNLPCLPYLLSSLGYETNAFHADWSTFYNRDKVYKKIGFDNYYSIENFKKDDLNHGNLSDESFLKQSYNLTKNNTKPKFNYYLTLSTHIPYILNSSVRPRIIDNNMANGWIDNYSNSIYYTTKEVYDFVSQIEKDDPTSIIVITGDHAPFLGVNKEVYSQTGTIDELLLHSTPLIFLQNGKAQKIDTSNMFRFNESILNIFGINKENTIFDLFDSEELSNIRPLYVDKNFPEYLKINKKNKVSCNNNSCKLNKIEDYITIYNDLLFGKQYSIKK